MNTSILVVDDDDAHRGMLRMMLQAWGYSVDEAADGDLAVEAVRAKPYDVVLTDVRMGRMDGIHALRVLCRNSSVIPSGQNCRFFVFIIRCLIFRHFCVHLVDDFF